MIKLEVFVISVIFITGIQSFSSMGYNKNETYKNTVITCLLTLLFSSIFNGFKEIIKLLLSLIMWIKLKLYKMGFGFAFTFCNPFYGPNWVENSIFLTSDLHISNFEDPIIYKPKISDLEVFCKRELRKLDVLCDEYKNEIKSKVDLSNSFELNGFGYIENPSGCETRPFMHFIESVYVNMSVYNVDYKFSLTDGKYLFFGVLSHNNAKVFIKELGLTNGNIFSLSCPRILENEKVVLNLMCFIQSMENCYVSSESKNYSHSPGLCHIIPLLFTEELYYISSKKSRERGCIVTAGEIVLCDIEYNMFKSFLNGNSELTKSVLNLCEKFGFNDIDDCFEMVKVKSLFKNPLSKFKLKYGNSRVKRFISDLNILFGLSGLRHILYANCMPPSQHLKSILSADGRKDVKINQEGENNSTNNNELLKCKFKEICSEIIDMSDDLKNLDSEIKNKKMEIHDTDKEYNAVMLKTDCLKTSVNRKYIDQTCKEIREFVGASKNSKSANKDFKMSSLSDLGYKNEVDELKRDLNLIEGNTGDERVEKEERNPLKRERPSYRAALNKFLVNINGKLKSNENEYKAKKSELDEAILKIAERKDNLIKEVKEVNEGLEWQLVKRTNDLEKFINKNKFKFELVCNNMYNELFELKDKEIPLNESKMLISTKDLYADKDNQIKSEYELRKQVYNKNKNPRIHNSQKGENNKGNKGNNGIGGEEVVSIEFTSENFISNTNKTKVIKKVYPKNKEIKDVNKDNNDNRNKDKSKNKNKNKNDNKNKNKNKNKISKNDVIKSIRVKQFWSTIVNKTDRTFKLIQEINECRVRDQFSKKLNKGLSQSNIRNISRTIFFNRHFECKEISFYNLIRSESGKINRNSFDITPKVLMRAIYITIKLLIDKEKKKIDNLEDKVESMFIKSFL